MFKRISILIAIGAVAAAGTFALWKVRDTRARAAEEAKAASREAEILKGLSAEDIVLVLENQALVEPSKTLSVVQNAESRKAFLKGLREYLALAAKARREGLAEDPNIRSVIEFKKNSLLGSLYLNRLDNEGGKFYQVPDEQINAVWADPENEKQFHAELAALKVIQRSVAQNSGNPNAAPDMEGEASTKLRESWAKTKILSDLAKADTAFMQQRAIELRLRLVEAGVLSASYLNKYWAENIRVTEQEIAEYLAQHPEYDLPAKKQRAETVLQRARAGEDFAKLAAEFSEDRSTRKTGGIYKDIEVGNFLWQQVQNAALELQPGQIAEKLVESKDGLHIIGLVDKAISKKSDGTESIKLTIRHILFQRRFEEPGNRDPSVPAPFLTPREIAEAAVLREKRASFVSGAVAGESISLPSDFFFEVTAELKASETRLDALAKNAASKIASESPASQAK